MQKIHNPVITDNYGNISRFAFRNPNLIDRQLQEISVYLNTSQYMADLTVSHEFSIFQTVRAGI